MRALWRRLGGALLLTTLLLLPSHASVSPDGTDDRIQYVETAAWDQPNASFTVVAFFSTTATQSGYLFGRRNVSPNDGGWFLRNDPTSGVYTARIQSGNATAAQRTSTTNLHTGTMQSLVAVFTTNTTTTASNDVALYANGVDESGALVGGAGPYTVCQGTCTLTTGASSEVAVGNGTWWGPGLIEYLAIYQGALTPSEVLTVSRGRLQRPALTRTLLGQWPLDTCPAGTDAHTVTFPDRSGNGLDGVGDHGAGGTFACDRNVSLSIPWGPQ
jgi:Concanavalin A-like lectin/glucanases superfamily